MGRKGRHCRKEEFHFSIEGLSKGGGGRGGVPLCYCEGKEVEVQQQLLRLFGIYFFVQVS